MLSTHCEKNIMYIPLLTCQNTIVGVVVCMGAVACMWAVVCRGQLHGGSCVLGASVYMGVVV
jgi:hypothetical protein